MFQRGLSDEFMRDLLEGPAATVLQGCLGAGLDVRLRDDYLNVYFRGRSLARIVGRRRGLARLEVHHKYLRGDSIGDRAGRRRGAYCGFDLDSSTADAYAAQLDVLSDRAVGFAGPEEDVESRILASSRDPSAVCCFDRQVQVPGHRLRLDVMGLHAGPTPVLVAIEVKRYPDGRIQDVPRQLHEYLQVFDPRGTGLRADVAASYRRVSRQLKTLGIPAPDPSLFTEGMPVAGLVVVCDYNQRSRLLPRAHQLAATLDRPIHLWESGDGSFAVPAPAQWVQMGSG
jgi:hypothetical protein